MIKVTIALAALVVGAVPATAAMFEVEMQGKVSYGTGPWGDPLSLAPFSATLVFDAALGGRQTDHSGALAVRDRIYGGALYADHPTSPLVSGAFTVDGTTIALTGNYDTSVEAVLADNGRNSYTASIVGDQQRLMVTIYGALSPPLDREIMPGFVTNGENEFISGDVTANGLEIYSLKSSVLAGPLPVPESASWIPMVGGLGAVSGMIRKRPPATGMPGAEGGFCGGAMERQREWFHRKFGNATRGVDHGERRVK